MSIKRIIASLVIVSGLTAVGVEGTEVGAKELLTRTQNRILNAKTISVIFHEADKGIKVENRFMYKQISKDMMSFRQEARAIVAEMSPQPFVQVMEKNKLYVFPTGCGDVVVRLKYLEQKSVNVMAKLFLPNGKIEFMGGDGKEYHVRYTCTPSEANEIEIATKSKGVMDKNLVPVIFEYRITKKDETLSEMICYSDKGRLVKRITFFDWKFDGEINDSNFRIPQKFKVYTANSEKEATRIQMELMVKARQKLRKVK